MAVKRVSACYDRGEMPLPGSDICVPALLGMEYPDPMGSGLSVPVLGCQTDLVSGKTIPLAGTMEDPNGKGLVAMRYGSQTVDPVTGLLVPVVGARLDAFRRNVVPVTSSYWLMIKDQTDSVQVEALQREVCVRNSYWQQQRQREEDILADLDSTIFQCLFRVTDLNSHQAQWSGKQLREAAMELQDSAQIEAQRRAAQHYHLALILPSLVLHILTLGDEEEWAQQWVWHSELLSGLDKLDLCMNQLQENQEKWMAQAGDWSTNIHATGRELTQRELVEQCCSRQTELEVALNPLHFVRRLSLLRADTAQAVLRGTFWFKEYGPVQYSGYKPNVKIMGLLQQKVLPLLEKLNQLLEEKQPAGFSPNTCNQHVSGLSTKQAYGLESTSRVWTASMPVVKGISTQSFREPVNIAQSQDTGLKACSAVTHNSQRHTGSSGIHSQGETLTNYSSECKSPRALCCPVLHSQLADFLGFILHRSENESQQMKESAPSAHITLPTIPEEQWTRLLELSPLFHLLRGVELQLKGWASKAGFLGEEIANRGKCFVDVLDAQWQCEGELIPLDLLVLKPREFLLYQHGLFLMHTLHRLKLTPVISLQIAASLPHNTYFNNAFRNSFFYQEAAETLFVRRQRLQSVGGFSLLLLHCLSHIKINEMTSDSSPAFQRVFFKVLQECLGELFQARLGASSSEQEASLCIWSKSQEAPTRDLNEMWSDSHAASLFQRLHKPSRGLLSEDEVEKLQRKHRETSLFSHLEELLREKSCEATEKAEDQTG